MKIIALIAQKGGVGKTTLAIHLAAAFAAEGRSTLLLDLDPQSSAAEWRDHRQAEAPAVLSIQSARLGKVLEEARAIETDIVILDTAPHSESTALEAARIADLILVPCQPTIMDLRAIAKTVALLQLAKKPPFAVLNGVPHQGAVAEEAATAIAESYGIAVAPVRIGDRVAFSRCMIGGQVAGEIEPGGKAAQEVRELLAWVEDQLGGRTSAPSRRRTGAPKKKEVVA
jgi:chromosome partitioning protein